MDMRGLILIGFSAACLGVASLGHTFEKRHRMSQAIAKTMSTRDCMMDGFDTEFGRVGCFIPVVFSFN